MIPKELWIENIIEFLKQIASEEFQVKGWVLGEVHDYCTFVETMCGLFDSSNFEEFIDCRAHEFGLSDEQIKMLDQIRKALNAYDRKHGCYQDPAIIIKDPEWLKIRQMARDVLRALNVGKHLDPSKSIIKEAFIHTIYEISRPEFQERIWIKERRPGKNQFRELVKAFFVTYKGDEILKIPNEYEITQKQQQILSQLYNKLREYEEKIGDEENLSKILADPEWHHIQQLAKEALNVLEFKP